MASSPEQLSLAQSPDDGSYRKVFDDIRALKKAEMRVTNESRSSFVEHVLGALKQVPDGAYCEDINDVYRNIHEPVLVRREDPEAALHAVLHRAHLSIPYKESHLNATEWDGADATSLRNPFVEGFSHVEGLVTVLGFVTGPDLVHHKAPHLADDMKDASIAPEHDVAVSGTVHTEELRFLAVRIPAVLVPEHELTSRERDAREEENPPRYIFRGVLLNGGERDWQSLH